MRARYFDGERIIFQLVRTDAAGTSHQHLDFYCFFDAQQVSAATREHLFQRVLCTDVLAAYAGPLPAGLCGVREPGSSPGGCVALLEAFLCRLRQHLRPLRRILSLPLGRSVLVVLHI